MLSTMAWVPRGYVTFSATCYRLLTLWRVSKLTGSGASSPPSRGNPIPICKVLTYTSIICAHVDRLSSELCVDWATLLSVSATSIGASSKVCTEASPEASPA